MDGAVLHSEAFEPDWEPAIQGTRLAGLRALGVWPQTSSTDASLRPVWHEAAGPPALQAVSVHMSADGREWSANFRTSEYFSDIASALVSARLAEGRLLPTDRVRYAVNAFAVDNHTAIGPRTRLHVVDRPQPLAVHDRAFGVLAAASQIRGDVDPSDLEVVLPQDVIDEACALTEAAGERETGGILIGHVCRDTDRNDLGVEVTAQIPARHAVSRTEKLTFTPDTWTDVRHAVELRRQDELLLGWWHSHPAFKWCDECPVERQRVCHLGQGFLSADDKALHRSVFPGAFTQALVVTKSVSGLGTRLFGWRNGVLRPRGFRVSGPAEAGPHVRVSTTGLNEAGSHVKPNMEKQDAASVANGCR
jgi:hypothetical protein